MNKNEKRILLIEDETDLRELYRMILEGEGYLVETAAEGRTGWTMIQQGGYDLVLLDIMMPYMDGLEILDQLANFEQSPQPFEKIVLLTNLAQDQIIAKGIEYGIRGYMVKSDYDPDQLIEAINELFV